MTSTITAADTDLLTSEEVIERLLSDSNLRRNAATCVLPAVRCGDSWRFRRVDLENWIRRQDVASGDSAGPSRPQPAA